MATEKRSPTPADSSARPSASVRDYPTEALSPAAAAILDRLSHKLFGTSKAVA
jgi:hypothetical protein